MSNTQQGHQTEELTGQGVQYPTPINTSREKVWQAMVDKMYRTEKYLPVTNVKVIDIIPEKHALRGMTYRDQMFKENIYFDESRCEIRAVKVDKDEVHVNIFYPDTGILEY